MAENADAPNRREDIERVLELLANGKLTQAQAAELIAAIDPRGSPRAEARSNDEDAAAAAESEPGEDGEDPSVDAGERHRRRHRHRGRHRHGRHRSRFGIDDPQNLGEDIERAVELGARTLRSVFGAGFGRSAFWDDASNQTVLSHARPPTGMDFECAGNHLAVSNVSGIQLTRSAFSGNRVHAADVADIELVDSSFTDQHIRGSSLRQLLGEHAEIRANELNGAQWSRLTIGKGRLTGNCTNGSQLRDVGISESALEESRFNGTKLKTVVINAMSRVNALTLDGVLGRNWLLEGTLLSESRFSGMRVDGLILKQCTLDAVTIASHEGSPRLSTRGTGLMRDVSMRNVVLKNCTFDDCVFDGTSFEGFEASNLNFEDVDFTGLVITSTEALARLAGSRRVA